MKTSLLTIFSLILISACASFAQQVSLVKDINSSVNNNGSSPYYTVALGSSVVFVANDPLTGGELWISNGSSAGTTLLKDIYTGGYGSNPYGMTNIGGTIYFYADDGVNGTELWKTNGTTAGTVLVKDINPGPGSSYPTGFTLFNGFIYFSANTNAEGEELWKTDGTAANTVLVADINAGNGGSYLSELTALGTSFLIFRAYTPANGYELYSYNGGTINFTDLAPGAASSNPGELTSANGFVFFRANNSTSGTELWKTNGDFIAGTLVIEIEAGSASSYPYYITSQGTFVYFQAYRATTGYELYRSNGTGASLVGTELVAGAGSSSPSYITATGGGGIFFMASDGVSNALRYTTGGAITTITNTTSISMYQMVANPGSANVYFSAYTAANGYEFWTATSTTATLVKDIVAGTGSSYPYYLAFTGSIFFRANTATAGNELWVSDGTGPNTVLVKDINSATDSNIYSSLATSSGFLISANDGVNGQELWKTDGTSLGTVLIEDILPGASGSNPQFLGKVGSTYFFTAIDNVNGTELWKSDGATTGGTLLLKDIEPGVGGSDAYNGVVMGSFLYFIAYTSANGYEIWKTDGTTTTILQDIYPGNFSSYPSYLTVVGSTLFFNADDGTNGNELWKSNGTTASMVKNINVSGSSYPYNLANVNGVLFFTADDGVTGSELWKSDGTSAGTVSLKDINSGIGSSYPYNITALGSTAYFTADDGINGTELWKSDGTLAGTVIVKDIYAGAGNSSYPGYLTVANSKLYFTAYEPTTGTEIYKSDGTSANTVLLKDIRAGAGSSNASNLNNLNETIYFSASDGTSGNLIYKSNGTTAFPASSAGVQYDQPSVIKYYNGKVLFTANTNSFGNEPLTVMAEPLNQPTGLNFTGKTGTSISASFTAAAGSPSAPSGYLVLRKTGSAPTDLPIDATTYTVGATIGTSTVVAIGAGTSFTDTFTGLANPPVYYYAIFSYNNDGTANIYRAISPLQGNNTPLAFEPTSQPTLLVMSNYTATSFTVSFTAATGSPTGYLVIRKNGTSPTGIPVDGTVYTVGAAIGDGTVAFVGTGVNFNETLSLSLSPYSYDVFAYNGSAGSINYLTTGPLERTFSLDTTPPVITNETVSSISSPTATTKLKVQVSIVENESSIDAGNVKVEYRSISGGGSFSAPQTMALVSSKWEYDIPETENGALGIEYKITAINSQSLSATPVTAKASLSFSGDGLTIPYNSNGIDVTNYRIVSIPLELSSKTVSSVLVDDLSASDKTNWRIFELNSSEKNVEMSSSSEIKTGTGYWLIVKDSKTMDTGPGTTVTALPYKKDLTPGWNMIGNPYNFNVLWSDVKTASGQSSLALSTWNGSWNDNATILGKFEGGLVHNTSTSLITLTFPVVKNPAAGRESTITKTKNLNSIDQLNWEVNLNIRNGDKESGFGGIGMNENAKELEDEYDGFTLPRFLEYMEVNHTKRFLNSAYAKDIVPSSQNHVWEFTAETNLSGNTEMIWDNSYFGKNDAALVLWDVEEKRSVDMRQMNSYSLNGKTAKAFKIFYGNKEFVDSNTALNSLLVHSVSPNPTNGQAKIAFSLPGNEEGLVQVRMLNMMGQPIASVFNGTLPSGYNEVTWNGKDNSDNKPPQGIYLVEVQSHNQTKVAKLIIN